MDEIGPDESRSFQPSHGGSADLKTKPIPSKNPTLSQCATGINNLHECLEDARGDIGLIKLALGLKASTTPAQAAQMTPSIRTHVDIKTVAAMVGATGGALMLFKIAAAVVPVAWHAFLSVN